MPPAPILDKKNPDRPSVFAPLAMIREARRQKGLADEPVPPVCILDPDGDVVRRLKATGEAKRFDAWPCYHSELFTFELDGKRVGIIGCAVGASYAVLIAEQLFACGCRHLVSLTSAGQIVPAGPPPYFVIIDRALRDEGTSYHYAPPAEFAEADAALVAVASAALQGAPFTCHVGASWTTDAPFRETAEAIESARRRGILAVEMEAAALYAFANFHGLPVLCVAHVTNTMGQVEGDFEKGAADGTDEALSLLKHVVAAVSPSSRSEQGTFSALPS
jgi:uridine phosphorylase